MIHYILLLLLSIYLVGGACYWWYCCKLTKLLTLGDLLMFPYTICFWSWFILASFADSYLIAVWESTPDED